MLKKIKTLIERPAVIELHQGYHVVRDDLIPGGSKLRFLPFILDPKAKDVVYASPFCGGAQVALSEIGKRTGQQIHIFCAKRKTPHRYQEIVKVNGGKIHWVDVGYYNVVFARAREYADKRGAQFLGAGFDHVEAQEPFVEFMRTVRKQIGDPPEVWCACASGMLTRCLGLAFPNSQVIGVSVGLASRHDKQVFSGNVTLVDSNYSQLAKECKFRAPFPASANYEAKAWEAMVKDEPKAGSLFWDVYG